MDRVQLDCGKQRLIVTAMELAAEFVSGVSQLVRMPTSTRNRLPLMIETIDEALRWRSCHDSTFGRCAGYESSPRRG